MKAIFKVCAVVSLFLAVSCAEKYNAVGNVKLDGLYEAMIVSDVPGARGDWTDCLDKYVEFVADEINVFYMLTLKESVPVSDDRYADVLDDEGNPCRLVDVISYYVSVDESDMGLQFISAGKKVRTDLFGRSGFIEELQIEEMSVDKLVLKGQREDCVYTLCKVNDTKKEALLKAGDEARLADIEDYVEGSNLN